MAGATPVAALDMWELATKTYKLNFPEATAYTTKASSISPDKVLADVGHCNLLLASPECTNHSIARGNRPRCEDSRNTAFEVIRFAKVLKPRWIVVENVLQMRDWDRFREWIDGLEAIGYKTELGILDAQFHGTPQSRRRLFVVADLHSKPSLAIPRQKTKMTVASVLGLGEPKGSPWAFRPVVTPNRAQATMQREKGYQGARQEFRIHHGLLRNRRGWRLPNSGPSASHGHNAGPLCVCTAQLSRTRNAYASAAELAAAVGIAS